MALDVDLSRWLVLGDRGCEIAPRTVFATATDASTATDVLTKRARLPLSRIRALFALHLQPQCHKLFRQCQTAIAPTQLIATSVLPPCHGGRGELPIADAAIAGVPVPHCMLVLLGKGSHIEIAPNVLNVELCNHTKM